MTDYILPTLSILFAVITYVNIKKQSKELEAKNTEVNNLKGEVTFLKIRLVPIEVSQRYNGLPRYVQYNIWYKFLLEEYPLAVNYDQDKLNYIFNYYIDFHGIR